MTATYQKAVTLTDQISTDAAKHASDAATKLAGPVFLTGMVVAGAGEAHLPAEVADTLAIGAEAAGEGVEGETAKAVKIIDLGDPDPVEGIASGLSPTICGDPLEATTASIPPGVAIATLAVAAPPVASPVFAVPEIPMPSFPCC